jgi:hypothetical protein
VPFHSYLPTIRSNCFVSESISRLSVRLTGIPCISIPLRSSIFFISIRLTFIDVFQKSYYVQSKDPLDVTHLGVQHFERFQLCSFTFREGNAL